MSLRPVTARAAVRLLRPVLRIGETLRCQTYAGGVVECERSGLRVGPRCSIPIGSVTGPVTRAPRLHAASRGVRAAASATRDCRGVPHVCFVFSSCYDICVSASVNAHAHKVLRELCNTRACTWCACARASCLLVNPAVATFRVPTKAASASNGACHLGSQSHVCRA